MSEIGVTDTTQPTGSTTAPRNAAKGKIPFTDKNLQAILALPFEQRPVGTAADGSIITEPVGATMTDYFVRDTALPGFCLRIQRTGTRSFVAEKKLGARPCRFKCGEYPTTSLTEARAKAKAALNIIATGRDPNLEIRTAKKKTEEEQQKIRLTFYRMMERDAERRRDGVEGKRDTFNTQRDRKNTLKVVKRHAVATMPVVDVKAVHIEAMIAAIRKKHPTTAIKVWRYARAAWTRLAAHETPPVNPFDEFLKSHDTSLPRPKRLNGVLPINEAGGVTWLKRIAAQRFPETAMKTGHPWTRAVMADYIICTLCWGSRKMEGMSLKWEDVDFEHKIVTFRGTKNKTDHLFPLMPGVEAILRRRQIENAKPRGRDVELAKKGAIIPVSEYVFPTERRTAKSGHITSVDSLMRHASEAGEVRCTLHDLRRTFAGEIALDILSGDNTGRGDFRLVKLALNHAEANTDITTTYMIRHKLRVLEPIYASHERKILTLCNIPVPTVPKTAEEVDDQVAEAMKQVEALASQDPAARAKAAAQLKALMASLDITDDEEAPSEED